MTSFTAVLINTYGQIFNITYTNLFNLKTKFTKKGSGRPTILHKWDNGLIILGYKNGKEININKHELPPPIDTPLFYGDFIVYKEQEDFTNENYEQFYNDIFQFEDLDDTILEDELEDFEDDDYDYESGFIVRDSDCDEDFVYPDKD